MPLIMLQGWEGHRNLFLLVQPEQTDVSQFVFSFCVVKHEEKAKRSGQENRVFSAETEPGLFVLHLSDNVELWFEKIPTKGAMAWIKSKHFTLEDPSSSTSIHMPHTRKRVFFRGNLG